MASADETTPSPEEDRFLVYLRWAREEVRTWPEWKQNLLGWHYSKKKAIKGERRGREDREDRGPDRKT
jgi:hypothetical protein